MQIQERFIYFNFSSYFLNPFVTLEQNNKRTYFWQRAHSPLALISKSAVIFQSWEREHNDCWSAYAPIPLVSFKSMYSTYRNSYLQLILLVKKISKLVGSSTVSGATDKFLRGFNFLESENAKFLGARVQFSKMNLEGA